MSDNKSHMNNNWTVYRCRKCKKAHVSWLPRRPRKCRWCQSRKMTKVQ